MRPRLHTVIHLIHPLCLTLTSALPAQVVSHRMEMPRRDRGGRASPGGPSGAPPPGLWTSGRSSNPARQDDRWLVSHNNMHGCSKMPNLLHSPFSGLYRRSRPESWGTLVFRLMLKKGAVKQNSLQQTAGSAGYLQNMEDTFCLNHWCHMGHFSSKHHISATISFDFDIKITPNTLGDLLTFSIVTQSGHNFLLTNKVVHNNSTEWLLASFGWGSLEMKH